MKYINSIILATILISSMQLIADDETKSMVILFQTINDSYPIGQYWPAPKLTNIQGYSVNPSTALIADDDWYSQVIESKFELDNQKEKYIGYYLDSESQKPIYLYGNCDCTDDFIDYSDQEDTSENYDFLT